MPIPLDAEAVVPGVPVAPEATEVRPPGSGLPLPEGFAELPGQLLADDPDWIPSDPAATRSRYSPANPWFERGVAEAWCLPGRGRIAVFDHPDARTDGSRDVFFGAWCSDGRDGIDEALLEQALRWARSRGADRLVGPLEMSSLLDYRVRLGELDELGAFVGEPYNAPDASARLEAAGFTPLHVYDTRIFDWDVIPTYRELLAADALRCTEAGYVLRQVDAATWAEHAPAIVDLVEAVFGENYGYVPPPRAVLDAHVEDLFLRLACPLTSSVALSPAGEVAGVHLCAPHWGPLLRQGAGPARVAAGELSYQRHWDDLAALDGHPWLVLKTTAVLAEHRRAGVFSQMTAAMIDVAVGRYEGVLTALSRLDTKIHDVYAKGPSVYRRVYALYKIDLDPGGSS